MPIRNRNLEKLNKRSPNFSGYFTFKEISTMPDLTLSQKTVFCLIASILVRKPKFYSTNAWIELVTGVKQVSCSKAISILKDKGYLTELKVRGHRHLVGTTLFNELLEEYKKNMMARNRKG